MRTPSVARPDVPKIVDHEQRRAEILEQSLSLFASEGYGRVTMRALATHLGVSTGVVYHYFAGKEALFSAMLRHLGQMNVATALDGLPKDADAAARLATLVGFMIDRWAHMQQVLLVSLDYTRAHRGDDLVAEVLDVYRQALIADFADGDSQKANIALSVLLGLLTHGALDSTQADPAEQLTAMAHLLLQVR